MIKTRFAPSPTGYLHVGGLRTALYSYLFAKKHKGHFILRIEDTDQERYIEGASENIIKTLEWMGLDYDEGPNLDMSDRGENGPYIQSKRTDIYTKYAQILIESGHAYKCFCSKERLDELRENQTKNKQATMYDRKCLELSESEIKAKLEAGEKYVVRHKMPYTTIKFKDLIRGTVMFDGKNVDDQVLIKSDGYPTYHLANVVDDHLMEITHVLRAEDWLPSTPKHIALYEAFGWTAPEFGHLPLLLNEDKKKLSKRKGDVSASSYIENGYLKEAILNFVAFLGWNPGQGEEKEIYTLEELVQLFDIAKVHKAGAVFDLGKLDWYNWKWMKKIYGEKIETLSKNIDSSVEKTTDKKGATIYVYKNPQDNEKFLEEKGKILLESCKSKISEDKLANPNIFKFLVSNEEKILRSPNETEKQISFYFSLPDYQKDLLTHEKMGVDFNQAKQSLLIGKEELEKLDNWTLNDISDTLSKAVEKNNLKTGQLFWPIRAALSGQEFSPGVFETSWALGKTETINRIEIAINKF